MAELIQEPVTILDHESNIMQEEEDFLVGGFSKCPVVTKSYVAPVATPSKVSKNPSIPKCDSNPTAEYTEMNAILELHGLPPLLPPIDLKPMSTNDGSVVKVAFATKTGNYHDLPFDQVFANLKNGKNHMYEVLTGGVIPYFDYDQKEIKTAEELSNVQADFWVDLCANVQKVFPKAELNKNFFVMFSSGASAKYGPFKFSAHIVVREHGYYTCGEAIKRALCDKMDAVLKFKCDRSVYKEFGKDQKMRMTGCYKRVNEKGSSPDDDPNRVLVPAECKEMTPEFYKRTIIQNTAGEEYIYVQLEEAKSGRSIMSEVKQSMLEDEEAIKEGYIEYTGQSDEECLDAMDTLFESWHPSSKMAGGGPKLQKEGFYVMSYKNTTADACKICGRVHSDNNTYMTYHPEQHVGYYKCHSANEDGKKEQKIKILGKIQKIKTHTSKGFDANDSFCYADLMRKYAGQVFSSFESLVDSLTDDIPRVLAKVLDDGSYYLQKIDCEDKMFNRIKDLKGGNNFRMRYEKPSENANEKEKTKAPTSMVWFDTFINENFDKFPIYNRKVFKPDPNFKSETEFNTWLPYKARTTEIDPLVIEPMLDFIKRVVASNDEELYDYLITWMSFMVCQPNKKAQKALFLYGGHGVGKDTIIEFMRDWILGRFYYTKFTGLGRAVGEFNANLLGKRLCHISEMASTNEREHRQSFQFMKDIITGDYSTYEPKGVDCFSAEDFSFWILVSNMIDALVLERGDRRYVCIEVSDLMKENTAYFDELRVKCFNKTCGDMFYSFLLQRNATFAEVSNSPVTKLKETITEISKPNEVRFIEEAKDLTAHFIDAAGEMQKIPEGADTNNNAFYSSSIITATEFYAKYKKWCFEKIETAVSSVKFGQLAGLYLGLGPKTGNVKRYNLSDWKK